MNINRSIKLASVLLIVLVLSMAIYAFAAANVVPASSAGDGAAGISGYTVSAIKYNLLVAPDTDPSTIETVTFTLDSAPAAGSTIRIKLVAAGSIWYTCSNVAAAVTCTTTGATVLAADNLRVIVAQ